MKPITALSLCFPKPNRNVASLVLSLLALPYWGCGGSSSSSPSTPTAAAAPPPCTQATLLQEQGVITPVTLFALPFNVPTAGRLDLTADWTFAANPVGLYVVQGACNIDQFNARSCNFLARIETTAKPKKSSLTVSPGSYTLMLANYGTQQDSGVVQVILSSASCPAVASAASAGPEANIRKLERSEVFQP